VFLLSDLIPKGAPIGRAFDLYGPRPIMTLGTAVLVFSIMMTSISKEYYQYVLSQGILFGLGVGMMLVARHHTKKQR
jgi:nitrate/nitrite transporter NarK